MKTCRPSCQLVPDLWRHFAEDKPDLRRASFAVAGDEFEIVDAAVVSGTVVVVVVDVVGAVDGTAAWAVVGVAGAADSRVFGRCFVAAGLASFLKVEPDFRNVFQLSNL